MKDPLEHVWAKSAVRGSAEGEHLTGHTSAVLARLAGWCSRNPELPRTSGRVDLFDLAAWACLLHDTGKCARGFQSMLRRGPRFGHRHEVLSLVAVGWLEADDDAVALVAAGVATHHKDVGEIFRLYPYGSDDRRELLAELDFAEAARLREWLGGFAPGLLSRHGFGSLPALIESSPGESLARSLRALDRLRRDIQGADAHGPLARAARAMRGLVVLADHAGSAHEGQRQAPSLDDPAQFLDRAVRSGARSPWRHQLEAADTTGNLLLVAPTGSGKTEAALAWAAKQRLVGPGQPPIFYVLPYRASLDAMHARIPERYGVPADAVVLQHSSALVSLFNALLEGKGYAREEAERAARQSKNLAALMLAPVRILTPYQLLRAFYGARGHEAVLTDASGALFILDELHAYELSRLGLILAAIEHLCRRCGARVMAMSATFPSLLAEAVVARIGAVSWVRATGETQAKFQRHRLHCLGDEIASEAVLAEIAERARKGAAVLVVLNTVRRAQRVFDALRARVGDATVSLLHSRFTGSDRARKERELGRRFATARARSDGDPGHVLVATQVVEVSLDVDFDVLFTDPAPIEALLQRFGRVNRGRLVAERDVVVGARAEDDGRVYDQRMVSAALEILRPCSGGLVSESATQDWVDAAYATIADAWRRELEGSIATMNAGVIATNRPLESHPELERKFDELFDGTEVVPHVWEAEYRRRVREAPLEAPGLHVPIRPDQALRLERRGRLRRDPQLPRAVAITRYDELYGLQIDA